jgi:hypothetical protein
VSAGAVDFDDPHGVPKSNLFGDSARRSELVALDVADIEECPEGLRGRILKSETDQEGAAIAICQGSIACPVAALLEWLAAANIPWRVLAGVGK